MMLNKNICLFLLSLLLFLFSCNADTAKSTGGTTQSNSVSEAKQEEKSIDVMVRIANRSTIEMNNVVIHFPTQSERYSRIAPGEITEYRQVAQAYRYAPIEVLINREVRRLMVTDYVGEEQLPGGNYTYALTFDPNQSSGNGLNFQLERNK